MSTEKIYNMLEKYLFAFSKEDAALFIDKIKTKLKNANEEEERKIVKSSIKHYFLNKFEDKQFTKVFKKYMDVYGLKEISSDDIDYYYSLFSKFNYEITFEDMTEMYSIDKVKKLVDSKPKAKSYLMEQLLDYAELINKEDEEEDNTKYVTDSNYLPTDNYALYKRDVEPFKVLDDAEQKEYMRKYKEENDQDAFEMLILCNQGLIKNLAYVYSNKGLERGELVSEGNIGLMKAIEKFDPAMGFKLSTYAMWWIRQAITRAIADQARTIRIPVHTVERYNKINKTISNYISEFGIEPTDQEISEITGIKADTIKEIKKVTQQPLSMNKPVVTSEDEDSEFGDFIESDIEAPDEAVMRAESHNMLEAAIKELNKDGSPSNKRLEQIIRIRSNMLNEETIYLLKKHGLEIKDSYTLEETGKVFGVTRERIRQLEAKAIRNLSRMSEKENNEYVFRNKINGTIIR